MTAKDNIVNFIDQFFGVSNGMWRIGGELHRPTKEDIETTLDRLREAVYDGEEGTQAQTGGILIQKNSGHYDVYLNIGEI